MSKTKGHANGDAVISEKSRTRRSVVIAGKGIKTSSEFAQFQSALIGDVMKGSITPAVANAASRACQSLLEVVKMEYKYGIRKSAGTAELTLTK